MQIVKWVSISFGIFIVLVGGIFAALIFLTPPPQPEVDRPQTNLDKKNEIKKHVNQLRKGLPVMEVNRIMNEVDSLFTLISRYEDQNKKNTATIDSLNRLLEKERQEAAGFTGEIKKLKKQITEKQSKEDNARELAKTFSEMKTKQLAPILNKLDDETILLIYGQMRKNARKDLLLALNEKRAAGIAEKLIN